VLELRRLRLLSELNRRGSLAEVARALSYSPSAVSQQLSQLEAETGVRLLERVGRGVRLTEQARLLVAHADALLERLEQAEADLAASQPEVAGRLRVASFQTVLLTLVPAALTRLAELHPRLRVEIVQSEPTPAFAGLLSHAHDVVLGEEFPGLPERPLPGVDEEDLGHDELRLVLPAEGPLARRPVTLAELSAAPWVMDPATSSAGRWQRAICHAARFEPDVRFVSPDYLLHVHLVETGHAVAMLPDLLWTERRSAVQRVELPGRPHRRLYTGVRTGAAAHPAVRAFRESLRHRLAAAGAAVPGPPAGAAPPPPR
jgi:DNA-binding transcriptional LysR family regulator